MTTELATAIVYTIAGGAVLGVLLHLVTTTLSALEIRRDRKRRARV